MPMDTGAAGGWLHRLRGSPDGRPTSAHRKRRSTGFRSSANLMP
ncbi:hypothetical protein B8V81_0735 [Paenibacillus pasadenensis]|uniref:Uncharacterized protein n=1 Tax=Paenibacillus pasadenensis TaxID=217090 RepID=A0A2N5NBX1_9BACL|nr:hypothetical protein B8V81_0735 [Paenibacillus pasadenensis]